MKKTVSKLVYIFSSGAALYFTLLNDLRNSPVPYFTLKGLYLSFAAVAAVSVLYIIILGAFGHMDFRHALTVIFVTAVCLRIVYTLFTGAGTRTYDVYRQEWGHLDYIKYIAANLSLPPVNTCQAYHPPVHHILSAAAFNAGRFFSTNEYIQLKFIQLAMTVLNALTLVLVWKILALSGINGWAMTAAFSLFAFYPVNIYFSSSINNDNTMLFFYTAGLYSLLRWKKSKKLSDAVFLAICVSLAILSKKSGVMLLVPAAGVFTSEVLKDTGNSGKYLKQLSIFTIIALPLSLSHSIRNYILFGQSFGYVPSFGEGFTPTLVNLFYFPAAKALKYPFNSGGLTGGEYFTEFLVKSSLFGEWEYPELTGIGRLLLVMCLALIFFLAFCILLQNKAEFRRLGYVFLINLAVPILLEIKFRFDYPVACTQDFRYIAPIIISAAYFIGLGLQRLSQRGSRLLKYAGYSVLALFSGTAAYFILMLGYYDRL